MSAHMSSVRWHRWLRTINLHLRGAGCSRDHVAAPKVALRRLDETREMRAAFVQLVDREVVQECDADIAFCEAALNFYSQQGVAAPETTGSRP